MGHLFFRVFRVYKEGRQAEKMSNENLNAIKLYEEERKFLYTALKAKSIPELKIRLTIAKILNSLK